MQRTLPPARMCLDLRRNDHLAAASSVQRDGVLGDLDVAAPHLELDIGVVNIDIDTVGGMQSVSAGDFLGALVVTISATLHGNRQISIDRQTPVSPHADAVGATDAGAAALFHLDGLVLLRLDMHLLRALLVLEANLVEVARRAALGATALDAALGLVGRQIVGRHVVRVVDPAGDDGAIGIALQEVDNYLLPDARDVRRPPLAARPGLRDPHPARAIFVTLTFAIPVKLDLHPTVLVGPDLLARLTDDDGGLGAIDRRLRRHLTGPIVDLAVDGRERALVVGLVVAPRAGLVRPGTQRVDGRHDEVLAILIGSREVRQREEVADADPTDRAGPIRDLVFGLELFEPDPHLLLAVVVADVFTGIIEYFEISVWVGGVCLQARREVGLGTLELRTGGLLRARSNLERRVPRVDALRIAAVFGTGREVGHLFVAVHGGVGARRVGEHQHLLVVLVLEVIVDPLLLQEAADVVEVRLPVLNRELPGLVGSRKRLLEVVEATLSKDLLGDVGDRHVLEDSAIGFLRQHPKPGAQGRDVADVRTVGARQGDPAHKPAKLPFRAGFGVEADDHGLAQKAHHVQVRILAEQVDFIAKRPAQSLLTGHRLEQERPVRERCRNSDRSGHGLLAVSRATITLTLGRRISPPARPQTPTKNYLKGDGILHRPPREATIGRDEGEDHDGDRGGRDGRDRRGGDAGRRPADRLWRARRAGGRGALAAVDSPRRFCRSHDPGRPGGPGRRRRRR